MVLQHTMLNMQMRIHHVYIFDRENNCEFVGYVGWIHAEGLKEEIKFIERSFG